MRYAAIYEIKRSRVVGQTVGAPYAPQLGIASVDISTVLAAQRSGSARAASSGPTALPTPVRFTKEKCIFFAGPKVHIFHWTKSAYCSPDKKCIFSPDQKCIFSSDYFP
jgi:hypothetical protein